MSRPRKNLPDDVAGYVDRMIAEYEDSGDVRSLTDYRLLSLARVSPDTVERWYNGESDQALQSDPDTPEDVKQRYINFSYAGALKRLVEYRRAACVQHIAGGGASTTITGWIFLSKQPHWGGFQDIQRGEQTVKADFRVTLTGPDGKTISG